ncbi:EamA domain-containing membrane protein RarD [Jejuia pallidilutea]|uniref:EamA domain-containing membrane protein RarD n=1 Tax=Jejuia pallidilutea TaxID=504487 RepID=A0A362X515_9FLAO|nr:DMT family transporter [Jejuia pallidilutea]PQV51539.1 EamA domain-containing membrane protein RarD [Jejuia pallidilutea]
MRKRYTSSLATLLFAALLISTSGSLGKFINLPIPVITWWRSSLSALFLFLFCKIKKIDLKIKYRRDLITILLSTILLGISWISYFYALKLSNVALGMLSLFTFPVITAFLEPLFSKTKLSSTHVILGIIVLAGIYILAPDFDFKNTYVKGILFGVFSAVCYALRNLMLKPYVSNYHGSTLMTYQTLFLTILLIPVIFLMDTVNTTEQLPNLIILALITTAIGHTLFIMSLKHFSVSTASIIGTAQPIFGIIIAFLFLNESPSINTYIGGTLILGTVIIESIRSKTN